MECLSHNVHVTFSLPREPQLYWLAWCVVCTFGMQLNIGVLMRICDQ